METNFASPELCVQWISVIRKVTCVMLVASIRKTSRFVISKSSNLHPLFYLARVYENDKQSLKFMKSTSLVQIMKCTSLIFAFDKL